MEKRVIITISREYGSGGREIGRKLAEQLGIPYYDNELISLAAKESGFDSDLFEEADQRKTTDFFYSMAAFGNTAGVYNIPLNDQVFVIQSDVIRSVAKKGSCVIVGRCADYVLSDDPDCVNIFINADLDAKLKRAVEVYKLPADKAESLLTKTDKRRASYYAYYSNKKWGRADNYHLCINSGSVGIDASVEIIKSYILAWMDQKAAE